MSGAFPCIIPSVRCSANLCCKFVESAEPSRDRDRVVRLCRLALRRTEGVASMLLDRTSSTPPPAPSPSQKEDTELVEMRPLLNPDEVSAETDTEESLSCWECVAVHGFASLCSGSGTTLLVAPRSVSPAAILRTPSLNPSSAKPPRAAFVLEMETGLS